MKKMEEYIGVRQMLKEGLSVREMSRKTGYHRETINKMILLGAPPGYQRSQEPQRPILGPFTGVIDEMLSSEQKVHKKQRHTAKRIFDRLKEEYGWVTLTRRLTLGKVRAEWDLICLTHNLLKLFRADWDPKTA